MSDQSLVSLHFSQPEFATICIGTPEQRANVLDWATLSELEQAIDAIADRELNGMVLYSALPNMFVAGADLNQIRETSDYTQQQVIEFCERGRAVMRKLSSLAFPSVAAIHGAAAGGGLELAMHCDYRIASDAPVTRLGLPEVKIGLIPGWSGTVHLPRLIGFGKAVDLITSGRLIDAKEAAEIGLVDELVSFSEGVSAAELLLTSAIRVLEGVDAVSYTHLTLPTKA